IVTGTIGDHGMAIMATRHGLQLETDLQSDVAPLGALIRGALDADPGAIVAMKDPTRGGVAGALHEMAQKSRVGVRLNESHLPVRPMVRGVSELSGIAPRVVVTGGQSAS